MRPSSFRPLHLTEDHMARATRPVDGISYPSTFVRATDEDYAALVDRLRAERPEGPLRALVFWAGPTGTGVRRGLPLDEAARPIAQACGPQGSNAEYLRNTVVSLQEHGIRDRNLWRLQRLVAQEIDGLRQ